MLTIKKRYLVDDRNEPVAVQIDLATWTKIEEASKIISLERVCRILNAKVPWIERPR